MIGVLKLERTGAVDRNGTGPSGGVWRGGGVEGWRGGGVEGWRGGGVQGKGGRGKGVGGRGG
jgi:hypothetical protein